MYLQVEKPFGKDLQSSRELQKALEPDWKEEEIFRIDHYLGKEMVKNLLILRFGNEFFGATWNRNHIDNVQVSFTPQSQSYLYTLTAIRLLSRNPLEQRAVVDTLTILELSVTLCRTVRSHISSLRKTSADLQAYRFAPGVDHHRYGAPHLFLCRRYP